MILHSASKWLLLLLVLLPILWWRWRDRRTWTSVRFSSVRPLEQLGTTWAMRVRWILPALRTAAIVLLILALARPQKPDEQTRVYSEGIAIQLLVDRSGSMQAMDFTLDGKRVDRLAAVRKVVKDFVLGQGKLKGRPDDLIGLIAYGTYADSKCPLTLDHGYLIESLNSTQIAQTNEEGATAIGDAIALGVEHLQALERQRAASRDAGSGAMKIKSKIMILLTDGESNAGVIEPAKAAEAAATYGIKVYTIGVGSNGVAPFKAVDAFGREMLISRPVSMDEQALRKIADKTGGKYFPATSTDSLANVYAEIDKLEKTKTEEKRYFQTSEWATSAVKLGSVKLPAILPLVFAMLAAEMVLGNLWLRRIP
jgi:Ca-activated chloride channel homolog